jgi:hypothetical protein
MDNFIDFLLDLQLFWQYKDHNINSLEKRQFLFCRKLMKIAENSDRNIEP